MKRTNQLIIATVAIVALTAASAALAQPRRGNVNRQYNPNSVETVEGTVLSVERIASPQGRGYGVHLSLQTADHPSIDVHLGPARYVDKQTPHIEAKDVVIVTGSLVTIDGKPAIIAAEVKKGTETLKLRDKNGVPAWSGRGRRGQ
jgi:hypothetical protein